MVDEKDEKDGISMRGWKGSEKDEYMGRGVQLYDEKDQYSMRRMNKEWEVWVQDKKDE